MANETHYGVISDVHQDPRIVPVTIEVLKKLGAEKLLINGDVGNQQRTLKDSQNYVAFILDSIGKSGLEAYVQPGSHETLLAFGPVMDYFADEYDNLFTISEPLNAKQKGHNLVFLPGSDFLCGGEYQIGNNEQIPSGRYIKTEKGLMQFEELGQYVGAIQRGIAQGAMQYANMGDLRKLVNDPDKTIVVCHVPRKFDNLENCVDMAHFYDARTYRRESENNPWDVDSCFVMPGNINNPGEGGRKVFSCDYSDEEIIKELNKSKEGESILSLKNFEELVAERKENRGNEDLKSIYEELGINKAVSGHFHESGHRANDSNGNHVKENTFVDDLFWNSGHLDAGQTGILAVRDGKVSYRNINLRDYLK